MAFVKVYGMMCTRNPSISCAVLLLRPLANASEARCAVPRSLAIEAPVTVPEALAAETFVIEAPIDIAADDCQNSNIWNKIGVLCRARKSNVIISSSSGTLWIMYYAETRMLLNQ